MVIFNVIKTAISDFLSDNAMTMSAALAFYTALSLSPLLILFISFSAFIGENTQRQLVQQITSLIGPEAGNIINTVIVNAREHQISGTVSAVIGVGFLLFSSTAVFVSLQDSINRIWNIEAKPESSVWNWLRKRILSLGMIMAIGFLLLVSLTVNTVLTVVLAALGISGIWRAINLIVTLAVFILLFALIYKFLPDAKIAWRDVWVGAITTGVLFNIGNFGIGQYIGYSSIGSAYGAAGSLLVLLIWVYYSAIIVYFGAEITQMFARRYGDRIEPAEYAAWRYPEKEKELAERKKAELGGNSD